MQLVIEIDEKLYDYMQTSIYDEHLDRCFDYYIKFAVKDGIPLPEGHGNLIDAGKLLDTDRIIVDNSGCHYIPMINVYEVQTIVEADKTRAYKENIKQNICGKCKEFGTVSCAETYREPVYNDKPCECYKGE